MKQKLIMVMAGVAIIGSSVIVIVQQSRQPHKKIASPEGAESELPAAMSNYTKTFKLNTNPPIWKDPANGRNTAN